MRGRNRFVAIVLLTLFSIVPTDTAALEFSNATNYPVGTGPGAMAVGDFNGDGKQDLVVVNGGSNNVSILLGNGDGTFRAAVNYTVGQSPNWVVVGDFNGDGKLDLAVSSPLNGGTVSILLGNGDGTFQPAVDHSVSPAATTMAAADFNQDGKLDLALANGTNVSILLGNGDGTFKPAVNYSAGHHPLYIAVADFNGDNKPDLAVVNSVNVTSQASLSILLGNGDGTFQPASTFFTITGVLRSIGVADFNGDGKLDVVTPSFIRVSICQPFPPFCFFQNQEAINVLSGTGSGTLGTVLRTSEAFAVGSNIAVADFNGDGKPDVTMIGNGAVQVMLGRGDATFQVSVSLRVGQNSDFVAVGDFNGDGLPDLAVANFGDNNVSILLNTSPTTGADLVLSASASPNPVGLGQSLTYNINVQNQGPQDATGVTLTNTLPAGVTLVSATANQGSCSGTSPVTCTLGALASPFNASVTIVATPTATGTITDSVDVTANQPDLRPLNNTASLSTTVEPVLTVTIAGSGSGTVNSSPPGINCSGKGSCSTIFPSGTMVMLSTIADVGSVFAGWSGAGCTGTGTCTVSMNANQSVTATFTTASLTVSFAGTGGGTVSSNPAGISCSGSCSGNFVPGTMVTLTAAAAAGSIFAGWSGAGCTGTGTCNLTMNSDQTVTATFNCIQCDFSITASAPTPNPLPPGQSAISTVTVTSLNGFNRSVSFSCSVQPIPALAPTCSVSSVFPPVDGSATTTLTIGTIGPTALLDPPSSRRFKLFLAWWLPIAGFPLLGITLNWTRVRRKRLLALLLGCALSAGLIFQASCGGGSNSGSVSRSSGGTPPGPYTITVTGSSDGGAIQHSTTVSVTVQ